MNRTRWWVNPIWTGLFPNLKRLGGGQNGPLLTWLFKSDDDETWYGHTMSGDLFKLVKNLMTSLSFQCYDVIVILKCRDSQKVEGSCSSFVFLWIKLNIGVGGNFGPLISNLSSKTSYEYKFLGKKQFSSLQSCFLARYSLIDWLPSQQIITYSSVFNFKDDLYKCHKSHRVCCRSVKLFLIYLAETLRGPFRPPPPPQSKYG